MEYEQLKHDLKTSATLKILRSQNAALVLSFLHKNFKETQRVSILQAELESKLSDYLEFLEDVYPEDSYPGSPRDYLKKWCDDLLLRKTFDESDDPVYSLTSETEKAIAWVEELQKQEEFVGTESRFLQIFALLQEIQNHSTTDVETKIDQLEAERDRIQSQIDQIRQSGKVERYNKTQLQERFLLANSVTRQLIADFRDIEQNFRKLTRKVQEAQLEKDSRKGMVINRVLDADQALKDSDQGKSFYAFWNFLMSTQKRQELKDLIRYAYQLEDLQALTPEYGLLRRVERSLLDAGEYIVQSNHRLTEKLRQMLDERSLQENRRVAELIGDVQHLALQVAPALSQDANYYELTAEPMTYLPMARPLHPLDRSETPIFSLDFQDLLDLEPDRDMTELYQQFYVDEDVLLRKIAQALEHAATISLTELIQLYPVTQGLPEIVSYLAIATQSSRHSVNPSTTHSITIPGLDPEAQLRLTLPKVIFSR